MSAIPSLNPHVKIRTTKNSKRFEGLEEGEDHEQPLSPVARICHEPGSNIHIITIVGCKSRILPDVIKAELVHTFLKNHRFCSLQVMDKENGSMKWVRTHVNLDDHVLVVNVSPNMESSDMFIEDYVSNLSRSCIEHTKPLWEMHILNVKTSEAEGICVFRCHHSLGDGTALMNLLLASARKASDPNTLPTLAGIYKPKRTKVTNLPSGLRVLWNSFVALIMFVLTLLFLEDTKTPLKGLKGVEHRPRRFVMRSVSLDDIKLVKKAMDVKINDVVLGVTQAGLYRYLQKRYSEKDNDNGDVPNNIRLRAAFFFNLRAIRMNVRDSKDTNKRRTWGNKIGYVLLPLKIAHKKDHLDYVRDASIIMERKKASLEPLFTYFFANIFVKLFGIKATGKLNHKVCSKTTLWFSNLPGPREEISLFGHEIAYIAPSCYGQPSALLIHVLSYANKVTFMISVDEETIPDPHKLCDDLQESLQLIKACALAKHNHMNK